MKKLILISFLTLTASAGIDIPYIAPLTHENALSIINTLDKPVIIGFFSPHCTGCSQVKPAFELCARELGQYVFAALDTQEYPSLAQTLKADYGLSLLPVIVILKNGILRGKIVGVFTARELYKEIHQALTNDQIAAKN